MIDLDRIDEYCSKATGEPWVNMPEGALWGSVYSAPLDGFTEICVMPEGDDRTPDFDFIAQARTDLPAVVAELREARGLLRRVAEMDPGGMTERGECGFCGQETDDWWDHFGDHYHNPGCPWVEVREFLEVTE